MADLVEIAKRDSSNRRRRERYRRKYGRLGGWMRGKVDPIGAGKQAHAAKIGLILGATIGGGIAAGSVAGAKARKRILRDEDKRVLRDKEGREYVVYQSR